VTFRANPSTLFPIVSFYRNAMLARQRTCIYDGMSLCSSVTSRWLRKLAIKQTHRTIDSHSTLIFTVAEGRRKISTRSLPTGASNILVVESQFSRPHLHGSPRNPSPSWPSATRSLCSPNPIYLPALLFLHISGMAEATVLIFLHR